jgi:hypothetical protein
MKKYIARGILLAAIASGLGVLLSTPGGWIGLAIGVVVLTVVWALHNLD